MEYALHTCTLDTISLRETFTIFEGYKDVSIAWFSRQFNDPGPEKTCHWGFRPGQKQTGLYSHIRWLGA